MRLRNVLLIARRDYLAYVARKRFWIGLLLTPAILLAFIFVPVLIHKFEHAHSYAVADESGWVLKAVNQHIAAGDYQKLLTLAAVDAKAGATAGLPAPLAAVSGPAAKLSAAARKSLAEAMAAGKPEPASPAALAIWNQRQSFTGWYHKLKPDTARELGINLAIAKYEFKPDAGTNPKALREQVSDGKLFAYFVIPEHPLEAGATFVYASRNLTDTALRDWFDEQATAVIHARKVAQVGLPAAKAQWLNAPVDFHNRLVTKTGAKKATAAEKAAQWLPVGYVYLLFIAIMSIAQLLMMSTIEEKSSRIAETLLASVKPGEVMAGKTVGVAAVGITQ
ncbi:MAG: ABC transporter permease, partial [Gammaproteobacteria bacterium]